MRQSDFEGSAYVPLLRLYVDDKAFPMQIEIAVLLPGATFRLEQFRQPSWRAGLTGHLMTLAQREAADRMKELLV